MGSAPYLLWIDPKLEIVIYGTRSWSQESVNSFDV